VLPTTFSMFGGRSGMVRAKVRDTELRMAFW